MISKTKSMGLLLFAALLIFFVGLSIGPIPQPQSYHHFADQRSFLGIAHTSNVLSNLPFALVGAWGLFLLLTPGKVSFVDNRERWPWLGVAIALILTSIGSAYYHLQPDNMRLVWDRLPMTILFMSYVTALICERINATFGLWLWPLLLILGLSSVWMWYWSELDGNGDLRLYLSVQVFALLTTLVMLITPSPYDRTQDLWWVILFFGLARLCEMYDHEIFAISNGIVSGHTLKHLAAALAVLGMFWMVKKRRIVLKNVEGRKK